MVEIDVEKGSTRLRSSYTAHPALHSTVFWAAMKIVDTYIAWT